MKKILKILAIILLHISGNAQSFNPFVEQGIITPSPLFDVASNGKGTLSFKAGNSGSNPMPFVMNQEMSLIITLSSGVPSTLDPIDAISGTIASYFNWQYDALSNTYQGMQNKTIPNALNGGVGTIVIQYMVTSNSTESSPQNGFNVNVTPPPYTNGINSLNDDQVSAYTWTVPHIEPKPDVNVTYINVPVAGNVNTNDIVPSGSTYGTPTASLGNPTGGILTMNSNGTYSFTATNPGEYKFLVPICAPAQTTNCLIEELTITVLDNTVTTNPPVANMDITSVLKGQNVVINSLANDAPGNIGNALLSSSVTITDQPNHGTVSVNPATGEITYTPNSLYSGMDTLMYQVCDDAPIPNCASATQIITVLASNSGNVTTASDDYMTTPNQTSVSGNVSLNDTDPEGNIQTVTAQTISNANGVFELNTDGVFTFSPASGISGPFDFPYTVCDDGNPSSCTQATLHILVQNATPLPASIVSFDLIDVDCKTRLDWKSLNEKNVEKYEIQRKTKDYDFKTIAEIKAIGNNADEQQYSYFDQTALEGTNEYRLRIVDIDGHVEYSKSNIIKLQCSDYGITLYPNPASNEITVVIGSDVEDVFEIKMYDMAGKVIYYKADELGIQTHKLKIPVESLVAGFYNIVVKNSTMSKMIRFEKVK